MRSLCGSTLLAAIVTLPTTVCAQDANRDLRKALRETTTGTLAARGDVYTPLIRAGQSMSGELSTDDTKLDNGSAFDRWVYEGSANERVEFSMTSGYANIVAIALEDNGKLVIIGGSDEARSASRIEIKLPQDGTYHVFAAGNGVSALGPYTFSVRSYGSVANFDWSRLYPGGGDPNAKYALLVGVSDYPGEASDLSGGPLLDVLLMKEVLVKRFGFKEENVLVLRDVEGNRDQVIEAFRRHLGQAGPNGTAVFFYSGHGMQMPDNRDVTGADDPEPDGKDEAIALWGTQGDLYGYLLDDEMGVLVGGLNAGRVLVMLDDCFAGTATRGEAEGALTMSSFGGMAVPEEVFRRASTRPPVERSKLIYFSDIASKVEVPAYDLTWTKGTGNAGATSGGPEALMDQPANHILLAASADNETSMNVRVKLDNGKYVSVGLFTLVFHEVMSKAPETITFAQMMEQVSAEVKEIAVARRGDPQTPQVEGQRQGETMAGFLGGP